MCRLGIFCFFDIKGVVDQYVLYILETLKNELEELWIVCNGIVHDEGKKKLERYADEIYYRDNFGYDAGAYQDVLIHFHSRADFDRFDELLLFNSTFYGPFVNWDTIFQEMGKYQYDCWSLSSAVDEFEGENFRFLQSYFRVFSTKLFQSDFFWNEWERLPKLKNYKECVMEFERGMSVRIERSGYKCGSWLDVMGGYDIQKKNVYREYSYKELIGKYKFPVAKYKSLSVTNYRNTIDSMKYICENTEYDERLIIEHQARMDKYKLTSPFSEGEVREFIYSHKNVYIFGHGLLGKGLNEYFEYNKIPMAGFVVTQKMEDDEIILKELVLDDKDGIIISVGNVFAKEIAEKLLSIYRKDQLLVPR